MHNFTIHKLTKPQWEEKESNIFPGEIHTVTARGVHGKQTEVFTDLVIPDLTCDFLTVLRNS